MLCSVPADRSGSNWLDRLRSTKGFPTGGDGLDLDHFLANPQNPSPPTPPPSDPSTSESIHSVQSRITTRNHTRSARAQDLGDEKDWYGIMTGVLSELFNMGDGEGDVARKSSRKQQNPRFFPNSRTCDAIAGEKISDCSPGAARGENAGWRTPLADLESDAVDRTVRGADEQEEEEEEKGNGDNKDLVGYSRSEVTVIDTSCESWKFEKVLYRRKNVWKVRERKGKVRSSIGRKKRKLGGGGEDGILGGKKKLKVLGLEVDELSKEQNIKNGKAESSKELAHNLDKSSKTRFHHHFCESPRKRRTGGSSVVLIKGIATVKSKKAKLSKSHIKPSQCKL